MAKAEFAVLWSPEAESDLIEIWLYGATENAPHHADQHLREIHAACLKLADWPNAGRARPEITPDLRCIVVPPHVVFYRVTKTTVEIVRVLHGRRDLDTLFPDDEET